MIWAPCGSGEGVGGWGVSGNIWEHGGVPTCMHMYMHGCTCTCMHAHVYMYRNCKWPLTSRHPCLSCLTCMCACMHACACIHAWDTPDIPIPTPTPIHPSTTPRGDPWNQLKFDNTWTNQDISIPFEDLKSVKNSPPMGGCMVWWLVGWVDGWDQVKTLKFKKCWLNQDIQFCLKIYDL